MEEICEVTSSKRIYATELVPAGVPFLKSKEIIEKVNGQAHSNLLYISEQRFQQIAEQTGSIEAGDVLLTSRGTLGVPYVVKATDRFHFADGNLTWFRRLRGLDSSYLNYFFLSPIGKAALQKCVIGSSQQAYTIAALKKAEIPLPPLPIQRRIAGILSAYDELIESSQRRIKILEAMARCLYHEWFVHFRFPGHESVPRVPSPLGEIPKGWARVRLADLGELMVGGDWGKDDPDDGGWVQVGCLRGVDLHAFATAGFSEVPVRWVKQSSLEKRRVTPADVLVEGSGECGRSLAGSAQLEELVGRPVVYSNFCKRVRFRDARVARYVEHMLNSMVQSGEMGQFRTGTTIPNLNMTALFESHKFILPSPDLLSLFHSLLESSDAFKLSGRIQNLRRTRDLLMPRLLSGQIDVEALPA
jgi:type I restriction enzyme S subunit